MVDTGVDRPVVRAAGAVLWRRDPSGQLEIAVIHRPKYDDWSLPKGKLDAGETVPEAASREVTEETGFECVLGPFLTTVSYLADGDQKQKTVDYFGARALDGEFGENSEVDRMHWVPIERARTELSYPLDVRVVEYFLTLGPDVTTVLLVRHAKAGDRASWNGDDDLRPLSENGQVQAAALRTVLGLFGPTLVISAPRLRCVQTVRPIAEELGKEVLHEPLFSEEGYAGDPRASLARLDEVVGEGGTPIISSQGKVIPELVSRLAERDGVPVGSVAARKGSAWLLTFAHDDQRGGPRMVAAHYLPTPLPQTKDATV